MKRIIKKLICLTLSLTFITLSACSNNARAFASTDLMDGITPKPIPLLNVNKDELALLKPFYFDLMRNVYSDEQSVVISPTSVTYALGMTLNGAKGNTKTQMENVLGTTSQKLNELLYVQKSTFPQGDDLSINVSNAIWYNSNEDFFKPNKTFLQKNADYYGAGIYKAKFDDAVVNDINNYVNENTKGRIKKILDQISPSAVTYLVNALSFDAKWYKKYDDYASGTFTDIKGNQKTQDFMKSTENAYFENNSAVGTMKHYSNYDYAFVALQPKQDVTLGEMVNSMTASAFTELYSNVSYDFDVKTTLPKFKVEYGTELKTALTTMGIVDAFTGDADFSYMCESEQNENIAISKVLHKAYLEINKDGTKAGAATVVEMEKSSAPEPKPTKTLVFDKPFMYMIINVHTLLPIFIGTYLG